MSQSEPLVVNGWMLYQHPCFAHQVETLRSIVAKKKEKDSEGYSKTVEAKLLAAIYRLTIIDIPSDPNDPVFRQGKSIGSGNNHWFRAKFYQQYRLFFRFDSKAKIIIYAWVNDSDSKRARGSKTDAYAVFKKMIDNGNPPNTWDDLMSQVKPL
jgi:toxin YhaV